MFFPSGCFFYPVTIGWIFLNEKDRYDSVQVCRMCFFLEKIV